MRIGAMSNQSASSSATKTSSHTYAQRTGIRQKARKRLAVGKRCPYCQNPMDGLSSNTIPTIDHQIPLVRGGPDTLENSLICCRRCNGQKGMLTHEEYIIWLDGRSSRLDWERGKKTIKKQIWYKRSYSTMVVPAVHNCSYVGSNPSASTKLLSVHDAQTAILEWLESLEHKVRYD